MQSLRAEFIQFRKCLDNKTNINVKQLSPRKNKNKRNKHSSSLNISGNSFVEASECIQTRNKNSKRDEIAIATHRPYAQTGLVADCESEAPEYVPSYRDIVLTAAATQSRNGQDKRRDDGDGFTKVSYKKRKAKNMRGSLDVCGKLQVEESRCSIYISRLKKSVKVNDVVSHIRDMGEEALEVERLSQHYETSFSSFKILIPSGKLATFLDTKF